jgi:hypothetical protein
MVSSRSPLRQKILEYVLTHEGHTVSEVVAELGRHLSEARAVALGRSQALTEKKRGGYKISKIHTTLELAHKGRMTCFRKILVEMVHRGKLSRVDQRYYRPTVVRLYIPPEAG